MPPRRRPTTRPSNTRGYARLEQKLALLAWLHHQLGYGDTRRLLGDIKPLNEGLREDGRSHVSMYLELRSRQMQGLTPNPPPK